MKIKAYKLPPTVVASEYKRTCNSLPPLLRTLLAWQNRKNVRSFLGRGSFVSRPLSVVYLWFLVRFSAVSLASLGRFSVVSRWCFDRFSVVFRPWFGRVSVVSWFLDGVSSFVGRFSICTWLAQEWKKLAQFHEVSQLSWQP